MKINRRQNVRLVILYIVSHELVLQFLKINRRKNVHEDKIVKINSCERKLVYNISFKLYSKRDTSLCSSVFDC